MIVKGNAKTHLKLFVCSKVGVCIVQGITSYFHVDTSKTEIINRSSIGARNNHAYLNVLTSITEGVLPFKRRRSQILI